jgi:hypothetical protein
LRVREGGQAGQGVWVQPPVSRRCMFALPGTTAPSHPRRAWVCTPCLMTTCPSAPPRTRLRPHQRHPAGRPPCSQRQFLCQRAATGRWTWAPSRPGWTSRPALGAWHVCLDVWAVRCARAWHVCLDVWAVRCARAWHVCLDVWAVRCARALVWPHPFRMGSGCDSSLACSPSH